MNQISSALAQAGVKLPPLTQRIWQVLHDSKIPRTNKVLASMLNEPQSHIASAMNNLYSRGMVALARKEVTRIKGPRGSTAKRLVAQWAAVGQEYELLPVLPTAKVEPARPVIVFHPELPARAPVAVDIEKMTLAEAHDLYRRLKEFFA